MLDWCDTNQQDVRVCARVCACVDRELLILSCDAWCDTNQQDVHVCARAALSAICLERQATGLPSTICPHQLSLYGLAQYELYLHTVRQQPFTLVFVEAAP
jgi:hypothetical protein